MPTSFGTDLHFIFYFRNQREKWSFGVHRYRNHSHSFFGAEATWIEKPLSKSNRVRLTTHMLAGLQPRQQLFFTSRSQLLLSASLTMHVQAARRTDLYLQVQGKTEGWMAGDEYLKEMLRARLGVRIRY